MTAALDLRCSHCRGRWDDNVVDGCPACDDGADRAGRGRLERDPADPPAPEVPEHALEVGADAILRALLGSPIDYARRMSVASRAAMALGHGLDVERVVELVRLDAQIDDARARLVIGAYARAVRGYGARRRPRWEVRTAAERAAVEVARACEAHAERIEAALPGWADAAE